MHIQFQYLLHQHLHIYEYRYTTIYIYKSMYTHQNVSTHKLTHQISYHTNGMRLMKYGYDGSMHGTGDPKNSSAIYLNPGNFIVRENI